MEKLSYDEFPADREQGPQCRYTSCTDQLVVESSIVEVKRIDQVFSRALRESNGENSVVEFGLLWRVLPLSVYDKHTAVKHICYQE